MRDPFPMPHTPRDTEPLARVLSLGAGVQSSAVLLASAAGLLPKLDMAVFADTGSEPPAVYEYLERIKELAADAGIEVIVADEGRSIHGDCERSALTGERVDNPPFFTRDGAGKRGMLLRKCTREYKIAVIKRTTRRWLGVEPGGRVDGWVEQWIGISWDEIQRMKVSDVGWIEHHWPLVEVLGWDRDDCQRWLVEQGHPPAPKSACFMCPYRSDREWKAMADDEPEEFKRACDFDRAIRGGIGGTTDELFVHSSCEPLESRPWETGQRSLWSDWQTLDVECDGMCGM